MTEAGAVRDLEGSVVLVSGGTQGVGAGIARAAALAGARVVIGGRRTDVGRVAVERLRALGADEPLFVEADVAEVDQAVGLVEETVRVHGRIDGLVSAAGLTSRGTLLDTTPEHFDRHLAVNLRAPFFLMQAAIADMRRRGEPGSVVNLISISAHGGQPYLAPYVAAKAGLVGLTRNVAHAHRWDRIRVNGVNLGWTDTEGEDAVQRTAHGAGDDWRERAGETLPMGRLGSVEDVAALVVLLLGERSGIVTGSIIDWDQQVLGAHD